jgi:hypothetical protein
MSFITRLKNLFWTGPRCARCRRGFAPIQPGDRATKRRWVSVVRQCGHCGRVVCDYCQRESLMFGRGGACECGGTNFTAAQMWTWSNY